MRNALGNEERGRFLMVRANDLEEPGASGGDARRHISGKVGTVLPGGKGAG